MRDIAGIIWIRVFECGLLFVLGTASEVHRVSKEEHKACMDVARI